MPAHPLPVQVPRLVLLGAASLILACDITEPDPCVGASVAVEPAEVQLSVAGTQQFAATVTDANGRAASCTVTWAARSEAGSILENGFFTAGTVAGVYPAAVTASVGGATGSATVRAVAAPPSTIVVSPGSATMVAGSSVQFQATGVDPYGNQSPFTPEWSVPASVGTISAAGLFTGTRAGSWPAAVTARSGTASGTADLTVAADALAAMRVTPELASLNCGTTTSCETQQFTASGEDRWGNTVAVSPTWSVRPGTCGRITGDGAYTGCPSVFGEMRDTVIATQGTVSGRALAVTYSVQILSVQIKPIFATVQVGGRIDFVLEVTFYNAPTVTVTDAATWTVSPGGGTIQSGHYTAGSTPGRYQITATYAGRTAPATVEVVAP